MADEAEPAEEVVNEETQIVESEQPESADNAPKASIKSDQTANQDIQSDEEFTNNPDEEPKGPNFLQKQWFKYRAHKKITFPLTAIFLLTLTFIIPVTRFAILGMVIKRDVNITILDTKTSIPVSGVEVSLRGQTAKTDGEGKATLRKVKVGKSQLKASKKYYKSLVKDLTIPLGKAANDVQADLEATGRQVPIHVINKITGKSVAGATIKTSDTEAQTDQNGEATLVLPAERDDEAGTVSMSGYNNQTVKIVVNQLAVKENTFALTPAGKIYFLSKLTGKIDVVKTDLDGGNRQTVLAGTGNEEDTNTVLLATRDWKYLALLSRREGDKAKIFLIDTSNDTLTEIDSGDASFAITGWSGHNFIYKVTRNNVQYWQPKQTALKTYNAASKQLTVIDENAAEGSDNNSYASESIDSTYLLNDAVIYTKRWQAGYYDAYRLAGKRTGIYSVKPSGTGKQVVKDFDANNNLYITAVLSEPNEIYFSVSNHPTSTYYAYKDGTFNESKEVSAESFNKFYPTFLLSPAGRSTFWYEPRDGKNTLFVGTNNGDNGKEIASLSEYIPYGWYGDEYILASKNGSELYILPVSGVADGGQILKIADYHKPSINFLGYGGGYGG